MKDYRKFCRPKTISNPSIGDISVILNCGTEVFVSNKDFKRVKRFYKNYSIVGSSENKPGNLNVINKLSGEELIIKPKDYDENKFLLLNIIGEKIDPYNGHDYVEIGGLKWATLNVGAVVDHSDSDYTYGTIGDYFLWADTDGHPDNSVKKFTWESYKYGDENNLTKYNDEDGLTKLTLSDDPANKEFGGLWRTPTEQEFLSLISNIVEIITEDEINYLVVGSGNNVILLPASGYYNDNDNDGIENDGTDGYYWTSNLDTSQNSMSYAKYLHFNSSTANIDFNNRREGHVIRPVIDASVEGFEEGDVICYNEDLDLTVIFSWEDFVELDDDWELRGLYGIDTYDDNTSSNGDFIITPKATTSCIRTLIIKPEDYSKVEDYWDYVITVSKAPQYEYVDLGLPSGTLWAKWNVGATSETEYGNYYQYGKGAAQYAATSGDSIYSGTEEPLAASADTAVQVWGDNWHMPTQAQLNELTANTTYEWTTINGVNGGKFTAANGNYVFFPAAGYWHDGSQYGVGDYGDYWGSSPGSSNNAYYLGFYDGDEDVYNGGRKYGYSVRGVIG